MRFPIRRSRFMRSGWYGYERLVSVDDADRRRSACSRAVDGAGRGFVALGRSGLDRVDRLRIDPAVQGVDEFLAAQPVRVVHRHPCMREQALRRRRQAGARQLGRGGKQPRNGARRDGE
ncbi:hypothetical protein CNO08_11555 [Lysobacter capsici]|nr:hypothetical protein CNO08_11555 [Lysobacter capsici]